MPYFRFNVPCALTTSTTTTTTTTPQYTVTIYGKLTSAGSISIKFQYSLDGGTNWNDAGAFFDSTTCTVRGSFLVTSGNSASIRANDGTSNYLHARTLNSTTCPGSPYTVCSTLVSNVTSNRNVAITVDINTTC
jgi:hypothetical protein